MAIVLRQIAALDCPQDLFPISMMEWLRHHGFFHAPLPSPDGGLGWGTEMGRATDLCQALISLGYGSLSGGRVYEAHVNALCLVSLYGNDAVRSTASSHAREGGLFGLWITPARDPVRIEFSCGSARLRGEKGFCTAAGIATRAVITALDDLGRERLVLIDASDLLPASDPPMLHGMLGTATKPMFIDLIVPSEMCFGEPGDYTREPDFSAGAWRTTAVTVGGLQALVDHTIRQLRERDRHGAPAQIARIGQMLIRCGDATSWIRQAAQRVDTDGLSIEELTGFINLARIAVEQACLDVIPLVQRSLGLFGFLKSNPVEGIMRDLATYLRQPAGDEVLAEAAMNFAGRDFPSHLGRFA